MCIRLPNLPAVEMGQKTDHCTHLPAVKLALQREEWRLQRGRYALGEDAHGRVRGVRSDASSREAAGGVHGTAIKQGIIQGREVVHT